MADLTSLSRLTGVINLEFVLLLYSRSFTIMEFYIWKLDLRSSPNQHYTSLTVTLKTLFYLFFWGADSQFHVFLPLNRLYISLTCTETALTLTEFVSFSFFFLWSLFMFFAFLSIPRVCLCRCLV